MVPLVFCDGSFGGGGGGGGAYIIEAWVSASKNQRAERLQTGNLPNSKCSRKSVDEWLCSC